MPELTRRPSEGDAVQKDILDERENVGQNVDPLGEWDEGTGGPTGIGAYEFCGIDSFKVDGKAPSRLTDVPANTQAKTEGAGQPGSRNPGKVASPEHDDPEETKNTDDGKPLDILHLKTLLEEESDNPNIPSGYAVDIQNGEILSFASEDSASSSRAHSRITRDAPTEDYPNATLAGDNADEETLTFAEDEHEDGDDWSPLVLTVAAPELFGGAITLVLSPVDEFLSPGFVIQRVRGNTTWLEEGPGAQASGLDCYYTGRVLEAPRESNVALSICNGVVSPSLPEKNWS